MSEPVAAPEVPKKFNVAIKEGKLSLSLDTNKDGEKLLDLNIDMGEAVQEVFKKGAKIEGAKIVDYGFKDGSLILKLDSDRDGETSLDLNISLTEAMDEVGLG